MPNTMAKSATVVAMATLLYGCQSWLPIEPVGNIPPDEQSQSPVLVDGAMQMRQWEPVAARCARGDVIAGPTGFWLQPKQADPQCLNAVIESPLFVAQTVALPVTIWLPPPWTEVRYTGATMQTTYTAMPVLPP